MPAEGIDFLGIQPCSLCGRFNQTLYGRRAQIPIDRLAPINRTRQKVNFRPAPCQPLFHSVGGALRRECDAAEPEGIRLAAPDDNPHRSISQAFQIIGRQRHQFAAACEQLMPEEMADWSLTSFKQG